MDDHRLFFALAGAAMLLLYLGLWLISWLFSSDDDPNVKDDEAWNYDPK